MSAPPIRYARTSDGVRIAYADTGTGHPFVLVPAIPWSNFTVEWDTHSFIHRRFSERFRFIRYDPRGCGMSERSPSVDFSLGSLIRDVEAVVEATGIERFAIFGHLQGAHLALTAAATWPERVTHLIVGESQTVSPQRVHTGFMAAQEAVGELDFDAFCEAWTKLWSGVNPETANLQAPFLKSCCDQQTYLQAVTSTKAYDVSALLTEVTAAALVVKTRGRDWPAPEEASRELAAALPRGELHLSEDPAWGDYPDIIADFIGRDTALAVTSNGHRGGAGDALSLRERDVLALIAAGRTNPEIAEALTISSATAARHVHNILEKLGMSRRSEAAAWWAQHGP